MKGQVIQCELEHYCSEDEGHLTHHMTTWLDADKGIRVGSMIQLKDFKPDVFWLVKSVSKPHLRSDIKQGWGMTDFKGNVPHYINER